MNISLEPAPNITISIDGAQGVGDNKALPFFLTGPAHAKELLASILEENTEANDEQHADRRKKTGRYGAVTGWLSPLREITLDGESRQRAGIPQNATRNTLRKSNLSAP